MCFFSCMMLLWGVVVVMCIAASTAEEQLPWWKTAVVYQVYPRSFKDTDEDGVGDLKGILEKADYFKELGVDAIWISPIYPSPMTDFGYDISNFTAIAPIFGTMDDFDALVKKLKEIDIKLLLDYVPNHTSDEHPWFQKSLARDPEYSNYYVWKDAKIVDGVRQPPNNWISVFSGSAWEWSEQRQQYYLHQFDKKQPDLNYRNPAVQKQMEAVINFWLDKGVDGFRMDAVQWLYEDERYPDEPPNPNPPANRKNTYDTLLHIYSQNQPETLTLLKHWADVVKERVTKDGRPRFVILEVGGSSSSHYHDTGDSLEFPFNFRLIDIGNRTTRPADFRQVIDDWMADTPRGGVANWVNGNHDTRRVVDRFGTEMVDAMNMLTAVLPGVQVVYYGEEIGMEGTFITWEETQDTVGKLLGPYHYQEESRDPERTPMQWDDNTSAGFSTNISTWLPVNPNYWWLNVEAQRTARSSHLKVFQALAQARRNPVLRKGDLDVVVPDNNTLVIVRSKEESYYMLIINLGSFIQFYSSQNLLTTYGLDTDMTIAVASVNSGYEAGKTFKAGTFSVSLRPKAALLLTSGSTATVPSSSTLILSVSSVLFCSVLVTLIL